jgi:hypothetical protein
LEPAGDGCARVVIIDEHHTVADEDLVLDRHSLTDERMALNLAPRANLGVRLNFNKGPNPGFVADFAAVEVDERVEHDILGQPDIGRDPDEIGGIRSLVSF